MPSRKQHIVVDDDSDSDFDDLPDLVGPDDSVVPNNKNLMHSNDDDSDDDMPDLVDPNDDDMPDLVAPDAVVDDDFDDDMPDLVDPDGEVVASNSNSNNQDDDDLDELPDLEEYAEQPTGSDSRKRCCRCASQNTTIVLQACQHVFCATCGPSMSRLEALCPYCRSCDPQLGAVAQLPYVKDLRDAPQALQEKLLEEYMVHRQVEVMESIEDQHRKERQALQKERSKKAKEAKDLIRKVREQLGGNTRNSQVLKDAKAKLEE